MGNIRSWMVIAAVALCAIAAWPLLGAQRATASRVYVAPVLADYVQRDRTIAFYESRVHDDPRDQVTAKLLAGQYMQRYRENQDVGDILRAIHQSERALHLQPQNNSGTLQVLGSAYTALHQFRTALRYETAAYHELPWDPNPPAQMASLEMELGNYAGAARDLALARHVNVTETVLSVQARYEELTGHLDRARALLQRAIERSDNVIDNSAQGRAWFHYRAGELQFSAGDTQGAITQERTALAQFPDFEMALRALARFCWATGDWRCALDAADKGISVIPEPETLGYKADAQAALGDATGAKQTQALIFAVQRIGNAYHINDRLLAVYYAEHGIRLNDALQIAHREASVRGDEIYAQDTLAWAAAMAGRWDMADAAARKAIRYPTQDPRIQFHTGMIALHFGRKVEARRLLGLALALNPRFDPFYARRARDELARLR